MNIFVNIIYIAASYLLGSFPLLLIIARMRGFDFRDEGDLHIAVWNKIGRREGLIGVIGDVLKGIIPIAAGRWLQFEPPYISLAGLAVVAGQMWPVFRQFNGERGNSTGLAMALVLSPLVLAISLIPIAAGAAVKTLPGLLDSSKTLDQKLYFQGAESRSLPVGVILGFLALPVASLMLKEPVEITLCFSALFLLVTLRRLTVGIFTVDRAEGNKLVFFLNRMLYDRSRI